ncbi:MAG: hypothetical protein QXU32_02355 [Nitrososphaerales archaeon]
MQAKAAQFVIWSMNGGHVPEQVIRDIENCIEQIIRACTEERLLMQVVKG